MHGPNTAAAVPSHDDVTHAGSESSCATPQNSGLATVQCPPGEFPFLDPANEPGEMGWFGNYRILALLGQGGMGMVFRAEDPRLRRTVAMKIMMPDIAQNGVARQRFLREARATAAIRSDHIVAIYEIGQHNDVPFLVTELLLGQTLDACLRQGQPLPVKQVLDIGLQIARGLESAHLSGLIHRDIKPPNIWLEEPNQRVKILDFGLARAMGSDPCLTQNGAILGTPAYMAPEQADGQPVNERCDLFSLGCVLYEMATGKKPFDGSSTITILKAIALTEPPLLADIAPHLPAEFSDLVSRLLAKKPGDRPASATEVIAEMEAIAVAVLPPISSIRVSTNKLHMAEIRSMLPPASKPKPRQRRLAVLAATACTLALVSLIALWMQAGFYGNQSICADGANNDANAPPQKTPAAVVPGVTDQEILLGMTAPFSGGAKELGREMEIGLKAYFSHVNDQGGIAGRKLKLIALDDGYDPERALANIKELYEKHQIFATIGNVGTPTAERTLPYALSKKLIYFGAVTGAPLLRQDPPDRYVFNYRASYEDETSAIVKYLIEVKRLRPEQIAVFAQQDSYGDAGFKGVAKTLRKYDRRAEDILRVGHHRNSVDVTAAVQEILKHDGIRAVVMVSTYRPAAAFIRQLKQANRDLLFTNVSFVGSDALAEELRQWGNDYAKNVIVTQVVPHPASHASAVLQYREALEKYYP
ncbi:MAG TPA: ABC transporter substrate-binding protein, partial [Gemmataceae bacterium]|nr:ABC transporter substrate-binding protein [Gemmataceae bacterium]